MFDFDETIEIALRTWYPVNHPLHMEIHHPLGKLIGELGELLDDYMKSLYKPGYEFEPLDELGDIWYYLRILHYQSQVRMQTWASGMLQEDMDYLLAFAIAEAASGFLSQEISEYALGNIASVLVEVCKRYGITLEQLTQSNWDKLKPGSERGEQWRKAREIT